MSFLTAVFSYNRGQLLDNCVGSIEEFSPKTEIVVFDDRSDDPVAIETLARIAARGHEVIVNRETSEARHGNYYANLNSALILARDRGYRILHVVEDDTQFMWCDPTLEVAVLEIFEAFPQAAEVTVRFWKGAAKENWRPTIDGHRAYLGYGAPSCHGGFVDVSRLLDHGFAYQESEAACQRLAGSLGFSGYALGDPVVGRIPWPAHARHRRMARRAVKSAKPFLLKPLAAEDIARLQRRVLAVPPRDEEYCIPWGWRCWAPYAGTSSYTDWARSLVSIARYRRSIRGLIPHRVGYLD